MARPKDGDRGEQKHSAPWVCGRIILSRRERRSLYQFLHGVRILRSIAAHSYHQETLLGERRASYVCQAGSDRDAVTHTEMSGKGHREPDRRFCLPAWLFAALLGLRFATPTPVEAVEWLGLSGETYPDRKRGGVFGWHREVPHIPAYLVPWECGCVDMDMLACAAPNGQKTIQHAGCFKGSVAEW